MRRFEAPCLAAAAKISVRFALSNSSTLTCCLRKHILTGLRLRSLPLAPKGLQL
jgi:hypothetical protein